VRRLPDSDFEFRISVPFRERADNFSSIESAKYCNFDRRIALCGAPFDPLTAPSTEKSQVFAKNTDEVRWFAP
jgi:hypothetical protein